MDSWKQQFEDKNILMMDLFITNTQHFTSQAINWWSGVDYLWIIVMFLSAVWTLILTAPIHCGGSTGEQVMLCFMQFLQICSDEKTNSFTSRMARE